jgi:hypothetical protein
MKTLVSVLAAAALLAAGGCSKKEEGGEAGGGNEGTEGVAKPVTADKGGDEPSGKKLFDYPPKGDGPHQGYDLGAIRDKLQGTWMVGSTAFNSVPQIWHLQGDELVTYDTKGEKSEHTLQLLAPCYAKVGDKGRSSATYVHFVFDGDTLYQGLGNSGLKDGDRTIGCMSAAVFVLEGGKCTMWRKKPFAKEGSMWETDPGGECRLEGDVFIADDSNSKRRATRPPRWRASTRPWPSRKRSWTRRPRSPRSRRICPSRTGSCPPKSSRWRRASGCGQRASTARASGGWPAFAGKKPPTAWSGSKA